MKHFKVRLSLRYKLLILLVSLPLITLGLYLVMATDLFQQDKVAYVFDSSATVSRSLATQTRMEMHSAYGSLRSIVENFNFSGGAFNPIAQRLFEKNDRLLAVTLVRKDKNGLYVTLGKLERDEASAKLIADSKMIAQIQNPAVQNGAAILSVESTSDQVLLAYRLGEATDTHHMLILSLYRASDLRNAFAMVGMYKSIVYSKSASVVIGASDTETRDVPLLAKVFNDKISEGTGELKLTDARSYLVSYAQVGLGDLFVISQVDKSKALKAVDVLVSKSLLFFAALLATTLLISVFASNQLTSTIRELFEATKKIGQGDFQVNVRSNSSDEVGGLAESFNWMAAEVSRLMTETAEKARMASELSTVKTVQETLFPASTAEFGEYKIEGHFEPASECGGDWWSYSKIGNKVFLWIGDATGHGAPAALITSAARSAAAVIETMPGVGPGHALTVLNSAIYQTSKGQIMMTFFIAAIDLDTNVLTYACASHDPPFLMRKSGETMKKKDLVPLNEVNGPRLGDRPDFKYEETHLQIQQGDMLFFYTDGIVDVQDQAGNKWGERIFLRNLLESANKLEDETSRIKFMVDKINTFREGTELIDDVTMVMCEMNRKVA